MQGKCIHINKIFTALEADLVQFDSHSQSRLKRETEAFKTKLCQQCSSSLLSTLIDCSTESFLRIPWKLRMKELYWCKKLLDTAFCLIQVVDISQVAMSNKAESTKWDFKMTLRGPILFVISQIDWTKTRSPLKNVRDSYFIFPFPFCINSAFCFLLDSLDVFYDGNWWWFYTKSGS